MMFEFLAQKSGIHAWNLLEKHRQTLALVAPVSDLYKIYYDIGQDLPVPAYASDAAGFDRQFQEMSKEGSARLFLVADSKNEKAALASLQSKYPNLRFAGLVQDLVAALISQRTANFTDGKASTPTGAIDGYKFVPVFATPRSGSSYLCDILGNLGVGTPREHLRDPLLAIATSAYRFDSSEFLRNFCAHTNRNGFVSTKFITHFVYDLVRLGGTRSLAESGLFNAKSFPIFIDRRDKVRQAISGALASMRKVWHITDDESRRKVESSEDQPYDFDRILKYYVNYKLQSGILDSIRDSFSSSMLLIYEDILDENLLRKNLARYLDISISEEGKIRSKISGDINEDFYERFVSDFKNNFGKMP